MKKSKSEDNLLWMSQERDAAIKKPVGFWELLYPEHPMIRLSPIIEASPEDQVLCIGCGKVHNSYASNAECTTDAGSSQTPSN